MDQLATQQAQNLQEAIARYLPLLSKVLNTINPTHAAAWIIPFANAGITDASFPTSIEAMKNTCESFGIRISSIELEHFHRVQYMYFGSVVSNGEYRVYDDDKPTPYKTISAPGFPKSGTFGQVEKVVACANPKQVYARKRLLDVTDKAKPMIEKEVRLLRLFKHPHCIPFHGCYSHQGGFFLVFDFADGSLAEFLKSPPVEFINLPESAKASKFVNWMIDIADALTEFHAIGGIHRDLKPENILIKDGTILIADFGLAAQDTKISAHIASIHGTEKYMAPEQGERLTYGRSADVFAMGCIFLEFVTFAMNTSLDYFDNFRRIWGSQQCPYSSNFCFRHNLKAVSLFIAKCLRGKSSTVELLLDLIEFNIIVDKPVLRIAARDVKQKLLVISDSLPFFKKDSCCSTSRIRLRRQDASMNSLTDRLGSLGMQEAMDVDLGGSEGPLKGHFF